MDSKIRDFGDRPERLGSSGFFLWDKTVKEYELRADELILLESACREADLIAEMQREVSASAFLIEGSQGQLVTNPLLQELRQHRALYSALLGRLGLPDLEKGGAGEGLQAVPSVNGQRSGGFSRWGKAHG